MKETLYKCDYCKEIINPVGPNTMINGKGQLSFFLPDSKTATLSIDLISGTGKNLERDACHQCIINNIRE